MSLFIWPRLEVLQLVIPSLGFLNRGLSTALAIETIRQLYQHRNIDKKIPFDRWLIIAKNNLRWNDSCIKLFWDMLTMAIIYIDRSLINEMNFESVEVEYLAIYLVIHISEPLIRHTSNNYAYDTIWPSPNVDIDQISPMSPVKRLHGNSPPSSPLSPQAVKRSSSYSSPKFSRSVSQHLHVLKQKLPVLLYVLSMNDQQLDALSIPSEDNTSEEGSKKNLTSDWWISNHTLNNLKLILAGGYTQDNEVLNLSLLHPILSKQSDTFNSYDINDSTVSSSDIIAWLDSLISVNETLYPSGIYNPSSPRLTPGSGKSFFPSSSFHANDFATSFVSQKIDENGNWMSCPRYVVNPLQAQQPQRIISPSTALSRSNPTVIQGCNTTTFIHIVTSGPTRKIKASSPLTVLSASVDDYDLTANMRNAGLSDDDDGNNDLVKLMSKQDLSGSSQSSSMIESDNAMSDGGSDIGESNESNKESLSFKSKPLPSFSVNNCLKSSIYLLSPYVSGSISSCRDTEIVLGTVSGAVILIGCERVKISVVCRKLVIYNCLECEIYLATLTPTVIIGDSRNLLFGPYNVSYTNLKNHLSMSSLDALTMSSKEPFQTTSTTLTGGQNQWSVLIDVNACLDAVTSTNSPSGYAVDTLREGVIILPTPTSSTAAILPLDKFNFVCVPYRSENQSHNLCPIPLPQPFRDALVNRKKLANQIHKQIQELLSDGLIEELISPVIADSKEKQAYSFAFANASPIISKKFMDWLIKTGKAHELIDLVRIDADSNKSYNSINAMAK